MKVDGKTLTATLFYLILPAVLLGRAGNCRCYKKIQKNKVKIKNLKIKLKRDNKFKIIYFIKYHFQTKL